MTRFSTLEKILVFFIVIFVTPTAVFSQEHIFEFHENWAYLQNNYILDAWSSSEADVLKFEGNAQDGTCFSLYKQYEATIQIQKSSTTPQRYNAVVIIKSAEEDEEFGIEVGAPALKLSGPILKQRIKNEPKEPPRLMTPASYQTILPYLLKEQLRREQFYDHTWKSALELKDELPENKTTLQYAIAKSKKPEISEDALLVRVSKGIFVDTAEKYLLNGEGKTPLYTDVVCIF